MNQKKIKILNAVFFYTIWWGCVLGIKYSYNYLGALLTIVLGAFHINIVPDFKKEIKLILYVGLLGFVVESFYLHSYLLKYNGYIYPNSLFPPLWILCMWLGFAGTLNYSMFWMKDRWVVMFLSGAIFGPMSYLAGLKLGVLNFNFSNLLTIIIIGITWGLAIPIMYYINELIYNKELKE
tara:strand:+ start:8081 stop:8620 length:540 start_codon:yes stop_codon:yes gene_type:complete